MKIRHGLVSNSSSSSFIVTGKPLREVVDIVHNVFKDSECLKNRNDREKEYEIGRNVLFIPYSKEMSKSRTDAIEKMIHSQTWASLNKGEINRRMPRKKGHAILVTTEENFCYDKLDELSEALETEEIRMS